MKSTTLTTFLLALPAITYAAPAQTGGCNKSLPKDIHADNSFDQTLSDSKSGVATRKYRIHIPQGYDNKKAVPLILSFHGRTQTGAYQEKLARFANNGFEGIAVYPEGVPFKKVCVCDLVFDIDEVVDGC
jgi:poly(3-hydroxybutyrate) depolymerase